MVYRLLFKRRIGILSFKTSYSFLVGQPVDDMLCTKWFIIKWSMLVLCGLNWRFGNDVLIGLERNFNSISVGHL